MFQQQRLKIAESSYAYSALDKMLVIEKKQTIEDKMILFKEKKKLSAQYNEMFNKRSRSLQDKIGLYNL